jgi:hypothetical protein
MNREKVDRGDETLEIGVPGGRPIEKLPRMGEAEHVLCVRHGVRAEKRFKFLLLGWDRSYLSRPIRN